ncbi:MAG: DUF4157 domain-containing protein [Rhodobacteraceae bacterium]|nr:DUF4157 domain-containing protein [Paracoccaceae bacterium]
MALKRKTRRKIRRKSPAVRRRTDARTASAKSDARETSGLMIGGAHDPAEKAADRMAAQVLSGAGPVSASHTGAPGGTVQRMCAECAAEEKDKVKRKAASLPVAPGNTSAPATRSAANAVNNLTSGRRMNRSEKAFFEPRFNRDFSEVRIHEGVAADKANAAIDAQAFTNGTDVALAKGQNTRATMAHELAHVVQDGGDKAQRMVRRYTIMKTDHPSFAEFKAVPKAHRPRVKSAMDKIGKVINFKKCKAFFKDKCSSDAGDAVKRSKIAWEKAEVFHWDHTGSSTGGSMPRTTDADERTIAYSTSRWKDGVWSLGNTFMHELFHTCILGSIANEHHVAEMAAEACGFYTPWIDDITPVTGTAGDTITITGRDMGPAEDDKHKLFLSGTKIATTSWGFNPGASGNTITFDIPASAKSGKVHAENHKITSNSKYLKVT